MTAMWSTDHLREQPLSSFVLGGSITHQIRVLRYPEGRGSRGVLRKECAQLHVIYCGPVPRLTSRRHRVGQAVLPCTAPPPPLVLEPDVNISRFLPIGAIGLWLL
jgi:hypothetical protein